MCENAEKIVIECVHQASEMSIWEIIVAIIPIVISLITLFYMIYGFNKRADQYKAQQDAIYESLQVLDDYLSLEEFNDGETIPVKKENFSHEQLVVAERQAYSKLVSCCKSAKVPNKFIELITKDTVGLDELYEYRALCRKELGLKELQDSDRNKIYIIR